MLGKPRLAPIMAILLMLSVSSWALWHWASGSVAPHAKPVPPGHVGEVVPELVTIEPGTIVGDGPPAGWSHLVIKSIMHLESGDVASLPDFARETATLFRTVVLADVRPVPSSGGQSTYFLHRIGAGLALADREGDTIVDSASLDRLGIELPLVSKLVLDRAEAALHRGRLAARTPTFALYDASVELAEGDRHRSILLRYALLVDPSNGDLRTVVWPVAAAPDDRVPPSSMIALKPLLLFHCGIHVLARRAFGQVPVAWYFAMSGLPPGDAIPMPPELQALAISDPETADESAILERRLRQALDRN